MPSEAVKDLAKTWSGPRSKCRCGHTGDGPTSLHAATEFAEGHGRCEHTDCPCMHFVWVGWLPKFAAALMKLAA